MQRLRLGGTKVSETELKELQVGTRRANIDYEFPAFWELVQNFQFNIFFGTGSTLQTRPMGQLFMRSLERTC